MNDESITRPALDESALYKAAKLMGQIGGSFAGHIGAAYFCADSGNKAALLAAFGDLFARYAAMAKRG